MKKIFLTPAFTLFCFTLSFGQSATTNAKNPVSEQVKTENKETETAPQTVISNEKAAKQSIPEVNSIAPANAKQEETPVGTAKKQEKPQN